MKISDLREHLSEIKSAASWMSMQDEYRAGSTSPLHQTVLAAYRDRVLKDDRLEKMFSSPDVDIAADLSQVLEENWERVKGTFLSYTAIPTDPITRLFCDFAIFCAEKNTLTDAESTATSSGGAATSEAAVSKPAILYLMPSLQGITSNGQIEALPNLVH
jgi:hypothetical protein